MAENKFIQHLKGKATAGSVVEIKNQATPASFANMPSGTSNANNVYADVRGNATVVAEGTTNWKLDGANLVLASNVSGDGNDYTGVYGASGTGLWVSATYTFPSTGDPNHPVAMIFNPNTKWVLKLCGDNLLANGANTIGFSLVITIGSSNIITKNFTVAEQANKFCKEFIIDFAESNQALIKAQGTTNMRVQLLCATASATARIYNGMTVFTTLQRKVAASAVSASFANVEEVLHDGILPSDYFSNAEFIDEIEDGEQAYAVFERDGDDVNLAGWTPKDDIATTTQLNAEIQNRINADNALGLRIDNEITARENADTALGTRIDNEITARTNADTALQNQITTNKGTMDAHIANTSNPHQVTKAQVGLGNVDNTADLDKPISTATQTALDGKQNVSTANYQMGNASGGWTAMTAAQQNALNSGATTTNIGQIATNTTNIANEIIDRQNADNGLQTQIDAIVSKSDVVDVVGTYAELQAYDTSTLGNNDVVKVLDDSTHNDAQSYYRWVITGGVGAWVYIGSESETYTKAETDALLNDKQDVITDLATIRAGAALGATALQAGDNVSELTNDAGYLVMGDLTGFVTRTTAQTISGLKTFSADIVLSGTTSIKNTTSGVSYTMLYRDTSGIHVGTSTQALLLAGSGTRPVFNSNNMALLSDVPTAVSQLTNDSGFITNAVNNLQNYTLTSALATVATTGSYNDLSNTPTIPTVNNSTITITQGGIPKGSFTLNQASGDTIALDAGGGVGNIDNVTITTNADDEIQAVAVIDQNTGIAKTWTGTMAEYDAIATKDPETEYIITDDIGLPATEIGQITEALNNKADVSTVAHVVTEFQEPTAANGYTWYRKYADGWVEQGGIYTISSSSPHTITLPQQMSSIKYDISISAGYPGVADNTLIIHIRTDMITTTSFAIQKHWATNNGAYYWQVSGMAA